MFFVLKKKLSLNPEKPKQSMGNNFISVTDLT